VRYTRQLAAAALIVAAGLGMGACSAPPRAAGGRVERSGGSRNRGAVVTNADHRALTARERLAEMRHQLCLGQLS